MCTVTFCTASFHQVLCLLQESLHTCQFHFLLGNLATLNHLHYQKQQSIASESLCSLSVLYCVCTIRSFSHSFILSFIPLACAECDDSLLFSGASSITFCYIVFPAILLHQLFFHPPLLHLAIYFLVYLSILLFPNSYIILFWEFYLCPNHVIPESVSCDFSKTSVFVP